ncbi:MAG TPA: hypothetical protein VF703_19360 [Pyrinomonadaceae bacterium]
MHTKHLVKPQTRSIQPPHPHAQEQRDEQRTHHHLAPTERTPPHPSLSPHLTLHRHHIHGTHHKRCPDAASSINFNAHPPLATDNLQRPAYRNVYSIDGGWTAWKDSGAPTEAEVKEHQK